MAQHTMARAPEAPADKTETYLRHIRAWVAFIGIVIALGLAVTIVAGIVIGVHVGGTSQASTTSSNCLSQGGTDPSC